MLTPFRRSGGVIILAVREKIEFHVSTSSPYWMVALSRSSLTDAICYFVCPQGLMTLIRIMAGPMVSTLNR